MGGWETHTLNPCDAFFCNFPAFFLQKFENSWHVKPLTIFLFSVSNGCVYVGILTGWNFRKKSLHEKMFKRKKDTDGTWVEISQCCAKWDDQIMRQLSFMQIWDLYPLLGNLFCDSRLLWDARGEGGWNQKSRPHIFENWKTFSPKPASCWLIPRLFIMQSY